VSENAAKPVIQWKLWPLTRQGSKDDRQFMADGVGKRQFLCGNHKEKAESQPLEA